MLSRLSNLLGSEENRSVFLCHGLLKSQVSGLEEDLSDILQRRLIGVKRVDIWSLALAVVGQRGPCRRLCQARPECDIVVSGHGVFWRTKGKPLD